MSRYITYVYEIVDEAKYAKQVNPFHNLEPGRPDGLKCIGIACGDLMEWRDESIKQFPELEKLTAR